MLFASIATLVCAVSAPAAGAVSNRDISISGSMLRLDGAGRVHVRLACAPDALSARCRGLLSVVGAERPFRGDQLGARRYNIPRGRAQRTYVKINRDARRAVAANGLLPVTARTSGENQNRQRRLFISAIGSQVEPGQPLPAVVGPTGPTGATGPRPTGRDGRSGRSGRTRRTGRTRRYQGEQGVQGEQGETGRRAPERPA